MDLDETDRTLLAALRADARLSYRELARLSDVSTPTAAAKVRRLEALGIIRGYGARIDPIALGRTLHVVELVFAPASARAAAEKLVAMARVDEVVELAGGLLHARVAIEPGAPLQELLQAITALEGLQSYRVHLVMAGQVPDPDAEEVPREVHVACHECKGPVHRQGIHKRWPEDGSLDHWFCCRNCAATFEARLLERAKAATREPAGKQKPKEKKEPREPPRAAPRKAPKR